MIINTNIPTLNAALKLKQQNNDVSKSMERLSSGLRINSASDDAAGLAISEKMKTQIRGLSQATRNVLDGISLIQTAEGGLAEVHVLLQRMRELSLQASNGTLTVDQQEMIDQEIQQLKAGIGAIAEHTEFNGIKLLKSENKLEEMVESVPVTVYQAIETIENRDFIVPDITAEDENTIKADIVFVIDHTGSMGQSIQNVKNNIDKFLERFGNADVRIGLVAYSDNHFTAFDFDNSTDDFKSALDGLSVTGGEYAVLTSGLTADLYDPVFRGTL